MLLLSLYTDDGNVQSSTLKRSGIAAISNVAGIKTTVLSDAFCSYCCTMPSGQKKIDCILKLCSGMRACDTASIV